MRENTYKTAVFFLTFGGALFSGYLSAKKFFNNTCAFNETCPYFLGQPACYYGFAIFSLMFLLAAFSMFGFPSVKMQRLYTLLLSLAGIIFSGRFVVIEFLSGAQPHFLGLSTCAYGLIFYIVIFVLSLL